jgi:hypothetical protein
MRLKNNTRGTILIWTVLLGVAMTSAFFFLATRMSGMGGITRETMEYTNQKVYLESYVDYIMSLTPAQLETIKGNLSFDQISTDPLKYIINGTLTNEVDEITGVLDEGGVSAPYKFAGIINIEWNSCTNNNREDIVINGVPYAHIPPPPPLCSDTSPGYDDKALSVSVSNPFTISTKGAPVYYRITNAAVGGKLPSDTWHLKASIDLGYGKKVEVEGWF